MKAEAWLMIEFRKKKHGYGKPQWEPKITRVLQTKPEEGMAVKVELEFPDTDWFPTIQLQIDPLEVKGSVGKEEMKDRAARYAQAFLQDDDE